MFYTNLEDQNTRKESEKTVKCQCFICSLVQKGKENELSLRMTLIVIDENCFFSETDFAWLSGYIELLDFYLNPYWAIK